MFLDKQFEEVITFKRGQSTAFEIPFKGWPQPSVKWTYNEGELPDKKRMEVETIYKMTTVRLAKVIGSAFAPAISMCAVCVIEVKINKVNLTL